MEMNPLEPQHASLLVATSVAGLLMAVSGVQKSMLDWRRRRSCPVCGRPLAHGRCRCSDS
jgi:hypothetical protein